MALKYFTPAQIEEIRKALATEGVRDTDLPDVTGLSGEELVAIVQDNINKKVGVRKLIHDFLPDDIADGADGLSAYQLAVQEGYVGTLDEWLASLVGPQGQQGQRGPQGIQGETGPAGPAGVVSATAEVDNNTGTPAVTVSKNGTNLHFAFRNLKGSGGGGTDPYVLPTATSGALGGIKIGYSETDTNRAVKLSSAGKAYVTIPNGGGGGGGTGQDGGYYEQIFRAVTHGSSAPSLPTNGATIDDTGTWKHYIDDQAASQLGDYDVWMAVRWVTHAVDPGNWQGPWNISGPAGEAGSDGKDIEFIYIQTANEDAPAPTRPSSSDTKNPNSPATNYQDDDWYPINWFDNPQGVTSSIRLEWMSFRVKTGGAGGVGGTWSEFSAPVIWSAYGRQGIDGDGVEYIYATGTTAPTGNASPDQWTYDMNFQNREYIRPVYADVWKDNPIDISNAAPGTIQWVSIRKKYADDSVQSMYGLEPYWHAYSEPAFWNNKARDGVASGAIVNLEPDMLLVPCDPSTGLVNAAYTGTTTVTVQYAGDIISGATIGTVTTTDTKTSPTTYNYASASGLVVTVAIPADSTVNFSETQLLVTIPVSFTVNGNSLTMDVVLTVAGNALGENGVSYQLKTTAGIIRKRSGVTAPPTIDVSCIKVESDANFTEYTPVATASTSAITSLGAGFALTYIKDYGTASAGSEVNMTTAGSNSITTSDITDNVTVRLKYNTMVVIQEYIPIALEPDTPRTQEVLKSIVFKRSKNAPNQPPTGTTRDGSSQADGNGTTNNNYGGKYPDQTTGDIPIPYGWSDGVPAYNNAVSPEDNRIWMSARIFTSDGEYPQQASWTTPAPASDTESYDIEFSNVESPTYPNIGNRHKAGSPYGYPEQEWFDPDDDKYCAEDPVTHEKTLRDFTNMIWMAISDKRNGQNGDWTIIKIKGETGDTGIAGKDAVPLRIRNWNEVYGQTLTGDQCIFSGFEDDAPFRDVIIVTPSDYPVGESYPFWTNDAVPQAVPALMAVNYSDDYQTGYSTVGYRNAYPSPDLIIPNGAATSAGRNWDTHLCQDRASSESALETYGFQWEVFTNLGAVYAQILVATQGYIGNLTVDDLLVNDNTVTNNFTANHINVAGGTIGDLTVEDGGFNGTFTGEKTVSGYVYDLENAVNIDETKIEFSSDVTARSSGNTMSEGTLRIGMKSGSSTGGFVEIACNKSSLATAGIPRFDCGLKVTAENAANAIEADGNVFVDGTLAGRIPIISTDPTVTNHVSSSITIGYKNCGCLVDAYSDVTITMTDSDALNSPGFNFRVVRSTISGNVTLVSESSTTWDTVHAGNVSTRTASSYTLPSADSYEVIYVGKMTNNNVTTNKILVLY